jgi:hypothetical protein
VGTSNGVTQKGNDFIKGASTSVSDTLQLQDWTFELKEFASKDVLFEYISSIDFGQPERPAVCYGFTIHERAKNDVELELFFNDWALS